MKKLRLIIIPCALYLVFMGLVSLSTAVDQYLDRPPKTYDVIHVPPANPFPDRSFRTGLSETVQPDETDAEKVDDEIGKVCEASGNWHKIPPRFGLCSDGIGEGHIIAPVDVNVPLTQLIRRMGEIAKVPPGAIAGILGAETKFLDEDYGTSSLWITVNVLKRRWGPCMKTYEFKLKRKGFCSKQHRALEFLCKQKLESGEYVCDMSTVKLSRAWAMGRMQHLPAGIVEVDKRGNFIRWNDRATDVDGDGVVDPFEADGIGMTAVMLRDAYEFQLQVLVRRYKKTLVKHKERHPQKYDKLMRRLSRHAWIWSINDYYGIQGRYFKAVRKVWRKWCHRHDRANFKQCIAFDPIENPRTF